MQTVIPAAGRGTRLGELTDDKPKPMVKIRGRPMISYIMDDVLPFTDEFVIVIGYHGDQIIKDFGHSYKGTPITYVNQDSQKGLAHAILQAEPKVYGEFAVALADSFHFGDLDTVFETGSSPYTDGAVLVEEVPIDEASRYGVVNADDGWVESVVEKPSDPDSNLVLSGVTVFPQQFFTAADLIKPSDRGEYEWTDAINLLIAAGFDIRSVTLDGGRVDVGYPEDVETVEERLQ